MRLQTITVIIAFLAGFALSLLIDAPGGATGASHLPFDPSNPFNGNFFAYRVGDRLAALGLIPLIFVVIAVAATAHKAGVRSSIFNLLGAIACAVGISAAISYAQIVNGTAFLEKERPFGEAGPARDGFVNGSLSGCTKKLQGAPETKGLSAAAIDAFCSCYANSLADIVTRDEAASLVQRKPAPSMGEKYKTASQKCRPLAQGGQ